MTRSRLRRRVRLVPIVLLPLAVALLVIVVFSRRAEGASNLVVVVRPTSPSLAMTELLTRLQGELTAAGFMVTSIDHAPGADTAEEIQSTSNRLHPLAVVTVSVESERANADVWVSDRATGNTVIKHLEVQASRDPDGSSVFAVRAVELLRGSLLELLFEQLALSRQRERPPEPATRVEPARSEPVLVRLSPISLEAGAAMLHSLERVGPSFSPVLRAGYRPWSWIGFRVTAGGFGSSVGVEGPLGTARVQQQFALLEVSSTFALQGAVRPFVSLGAGAYRMAVDGTANGAYRGVETSFWAAAVDAGVGGRFHMGDRIALGLEMHALMTSPYPMVRIVDYDAGRTGRPSLLGSLTLVGWL